MAHILLRVRDETRGDGADVRKPVLGEPNDHGQILFLTSHSHVLSAGCWTGADDRERGGLDDLSRHRQW
jgi:hypothetical protein